MRPAGVLPGFGADFTWYFAQHWGVTAGAEAAFFNVRLFTVNISTHSSGSPPYLLKQSSRVNATYLRIPLWLRFRAPLGRHWFYAAAGLSADLALSGHYRTETEMRTGSSAATQTTITTGSLSFGHGASLAAETGLRWTLAEHWGLYTGLYAGYGLPDTRPSGDTFSEIGETHLLSAGMKVKIAFGW
jgi:hypothetical protein